MKHFLRLRFLLLFLTTAAAAQTPGPDRLNAGLVIWLQLDETVGPRAQDASGAGKSGQLPNGGTWHAAGKIGGSVHLTNTVPDKASLQIPLTWQPTAFTVSWWVYADALSDWSQAVGANLNESNTWSGFLFHASASGRVYVDTDLFTRLESQPELFVTGAWQHFVFTFDRGQAALYKNNRLEEYRASGMVMPAPWRALSFGSATNGTLPVNCYLDDIRVYDRGTVPH